jgi:hypothetical protein
MENFPRFPSSARRYVLDVPGFSLGDQLYRLIARCTYERERGHPLVVLIWETACPSCERVFRLMTRRTSSTIRRRCEHCCRPGYRVADELRARGLFPLQPRPHKEVKPSRSARNRDAKSAAA